jgi:type 1 glutamine amidotransferase
MFMPPSKTKTLFCIIVCLVFISCALDEDLVSTDTIDSELPISTTTTTTTTATEPEGTSEEETLEEETSDEEEPSNDETNDIEEKILIFTKTEGFRHNSIEAGIQLLTMLGSDNNFQIDQTEDALNFSDANLLQYQLVVFLNTTGDILNLAQQTAFENYIQAGGSYMGIHAATDTEYDWPWYGQLVGAYFNGHPVIQNATMTVQISDHPSTEHLNTSWTRTDEWYNFKDINSTINTLLYLDETSYEGGTNGEDHPIAWYHEFDGGRSFYTGGGHTEESYEEPAFQQHLLGGILYCLDRE